MVWCGGGYGMLMTGFEKLNFCRTDTPIKSQLHYLFTRLQQTKGGNKRTTKLKFNYSHKHLEICKYTHQLLKCMLCIFRSY